VYDNDLSEENRKNWKSIRSLIQVTRIVIEKEKTKQEVAYFISNLDSNTSARYFLQAIRNHWGIESFHYSKDVTFLEDKWKVRTKNAPVNYSLMRTLAINIFRQNGFQKIQEVMERCANNVRFMRGLF
jgi:predicted transposase YbfD/YdcC